MLKTEISKKLARFLIEPRKKPSIQYNELLEDNIGPITGKLNELLPDYSIFYNPESEKKSLENVVTKIAQKEANLSEIFIEFATEADKISFECLGKINEKYNLELSNEEQDVLALIMYRASKDSNKLPYDILLEELKKFNKDNDSQAASSKGQAEVVEQSNGENANLSEDQMIEIAQKCFGQIAEKMADKGLTLEVLFKDQIFTQEGEEEKIYLVSQEDFKEGLKKLGIEDLHNVEYSSLFKILSANDEEKNIRINELAQILEECGIGDGEQLNFDELDKISMVIMLALSEYVIKSNTKLEDLFAEKIEEQTIEEEGEKATLHFVSNKDFFAVLKEIGIEIDESENDNLKNFLCLDSEKKKISLEKLKASLEEFVNNEELREKAHKYYQELNEGEGDEENAGEESEKNNEKDKEKK